MLSVSDMFYTANEEPVLVIAEPDRSRAQFRRGHLSRQDSRNFRSSASPPPSRSNHHASSWYGHRKSSQSPPRSRRGAYEPDYSDYRSSRYGYGRSPERSGISKFFHRRDSQSPPSSYHESQSHTKYKEDYTGYPLESGYTAKDGYEPGYDRDYGREYGRSSRHGHSSSHSGGHGYSTEIYHGDRRGTIPRTYENAYGSPTVYGKYSETIKLKVPLCCEACEERITNHMLALEGVESVTCDQAKQKVTVIGTASPSEVLRQGRECFKNTTFW
ncbi:unnamed protein product [Calypogeia fissa]